MLVSDRKRRRISIRLRRKSESKKGSVQELLVRQVAVAQQALRLGSDVLSRVRDAQESRGKMRHIEHQGDDARINLSERVNVAVTVPLEREDLVRASRALDDITDTLRDMVREAAKWDLHTGSWSRGLLDPAHEALEGLQEAILATGPQSRDAALRARSFSGQLRRNYQQGMTEVFRQELSMEMLKRIEILKRVDQVGLLLAATSDAIVDGVVKRYI